MIFEASTLRNIIRSFSIFISLFTLGCTESRDTTLVEDIAQNETTFVQRNLNKEAYFGDTHVHTVLSLDAFLFGTRRTPNDAINLQKANQ